MQTFLNNFIIFIEFALNELIYDFHIRDILRLLIDLFAEISDFNYLRFIKREKVNNCHDVEHLSRRDTCFI